MNLCTKEKCICMYKYLKEKEKFAVFPSWAELKSVVMTKKIK